MQIYYGTSYKHEPYETFDHTGYFLMLFNRLYWRVWTLVQITVKMLTNQPTNKPQTSCCKIFHERSTILYLAIQQNDCCHVSLKIIINNMSTTGQYPDYIRILKILLFTKNASQQHPSIHTSVWPWHFKLKFCIPFLSHHISMDLINLLQQCQKNHTNHNKIYVIQSSYFNLQPPNGLLPEDFSPKFHMHYNWFMLHPHLTFLNIST